MALRILTEKIMDSVVMTQARTGATFDLWNAEKLSIVVTGSAVSTPVGTSAQLQVSNDGTNWVSLGSAVALTTAVSAAIPEADCVAAVRYKYGRMTYAWGSGSINYSTFVLVKGGAM